MIQKNLDVRLSIKELRLKELRVAEEMGINEQNFNRMLRLELSSTKV